MSTQLIKKRIAATQQGNRGLTTLEYIILGFLGMKPQSGYDIINNFETGI